MASNTRAICLTMGIAMQWAQKTWKKKGGGSNGSKKLLYEKWDGTGKSA